MARPIDQDAKDIAKYQNLLKKLRAASAVLVLSEFEDGAAHSIINETIEEVKARIVELL
jgi:hypothetical protein